MPIPALAPGLNDEEDCADGSADPEVVLEVFEGRLFDREEVLEGEESVEAEPVEAEAEAEVEADAAVLSEAVKVIEEVDELDCAVE